VRAEAAAAVLAAAVVAAPAAGADETRYDSFAYENGWGATSLMSPPAPARGMRFPSAWSDGGSENVVFAQDNRRVRLLALDSEATNFVAGDRNGMRDVFVIHRGRGAGNTTGRFELASVASGGRQANAPSRNPSLSGETHVPARCVAFESRATNLDPLDRAGDSDVYVRDLRARRTWLVSHRVRDARDPVVDGRCETVTFAAGGRVLVADARRRAVFVVARGADPDQQTNGEGVASYRVERRGARTALRRGRERLVSDTRAGRPGNGVSGDPAADDRGHYVAFESTATDLCVRRCTGVSADANGATSDVFRRTISRAAPTRDSMQMASYSFDERAQGDGASRNPAISGAGENVAFDSEALNFGFSGQTYAHQTNGRQPNVFSWTFPRARRYGNVKYLARTRCQGGCRGPELEPSMSSRGNYIAFVVWMNEYCDPTRERFAGDRECPLHTDVYMRYMGPSHEGYPEG
jgi:hypothetical protein